MAPTANDSAAAAAAAPAPAPAIPEQYMHKNRLQQFALRTYKKLPVYNIDREGEYHLPKFKCTVEVGGQKFSSTQSFSRSKEAQQDAARVAYETLVTRDDGTVGQALELIDQDVVFCKSILSEFSDKKKTTRPTYSVARQEEPIILFVGSVVFDGNTYTGEAATSKKDAEQKAARAAVKSILATGNTCMKEIVKSKENLITAIKSSRSSKETGAVSQEAHNTPKTLTTFTPIKFTRPAAYTAYGGPDHVAPESQHQASLLMTVEEQSIVSAVDPSVNPSAKAVTRSRKRKVEPECQR